jgi:hypothetical protein
MDGQLKAIPRIFSTILLSLLVAASGTFLAYQLWTGVRMMPTLRMEGFAGPSHGAGVPDCTRTSQESARLIGIFQTKKSTTGEGADDLRELSVLLGKLSCFKKDLMSPGKLVEATRKQPFSNSHDMEPIAETAARCFAKTIPKRDLQLSFDKWTKRGTFLVKRLCTSYNLAGDDLKAAYDLFNAAMADFASVAGEVCFVGDIIIGGAPGPRVLSGVEPPGLSSHMDYKGYY